MELAALCCAPACSLDGLTDGDASAAVASSTTSASAGGAGGSGGAASSSGAGLFGGAGAAAGNDLWARALGGLDDNQEGHAVAVGAGCADGGCVLVGGWFQGEGEFGGANFVSEGGYDAFVASFDAKGKHRWSHAFGDGNDNRLWAMAADPDGNPIIVGRSRGTVTLPGGAVTLEALEGYNGFVAKLDRDDGEAIWGRTIGETEKVTPDENQYAEAVAVDAQGNIIVVGFYGGELTLGSKTLTSLDEQDLFVLKLSPEGEVVWAISLDGHTSANAVTVAVDPGGQVYVGGVFSGTLGGGCPSTVSQSGTDAFVVALAATNGSCTWAHSWKSPGSSQYVRGLAPIGGDVVVALEVVNDIVLDEMPLAGNGTDIALTRLAGSDGAPMWGFRTNDPHNQRVAAVAVDPATDDIVITGSYEGALTFNGQASLFTMGGPDIVLARFDSEGQLRWAQGFGEKSGDDFGYAVAVDVEGNEVMTGEFTLNIAFGKTDITSHGSGDIFLTKFGPQAP